MSRVLICYTHISPRLVRRIQCLGERVPGLVAVEIAGREKAYPWWAGDHILGSVPKKRLFNTDLESLTQAQIISAIDPLLEQEKPEIGIVADYSSAAMRYLARSIRRRGGRTILPALSWAGDRRRWIVREWLKGILVRGLFDAVCAGGERAQNYFSGLGFSDDRLWKQFNVVDNVHFEKGANAARQIGESLRGDLGLPPNFFLYVGAIEPKKNVHGLLTSYAHYRKTGGKWGLVILGSGSQLSDLQERVKSEQISAVIFTGLKTHDETPAYYGLASCLIIPSLSEPWGLTVNEAAAAGLPILASNKCGCVPELVHKGINGYPFDPRNYQELVGLMHLISNNVRLSRSMGSSSRQLIQYYTPERWADALADCVRSLAQA